MSGTLPPGVLPMITNTDPLPLHPNTIVGDGFVGAVPFCEDTPHVLFDGNTLSCTMGNWIGAPTAYAYQWQIGGSDVGQDAPTYDVQAGDNGDAICIVTASNAYGSTVAPPSNAVTVAGGAARRRARHDEHHEPEGRQEHAGRH
jgi:hypothetical protein